MTAGLLSPLVSLLSARPASTAFENYHRVWLYLQNRRENRALIFSRRNAGSRAARGIDDRIPALFRHCRERYVDRHAGHVENHVKVFFVRSQTSNGEGKELGQAVVPWRLI